MAQLQVLSDDITGSNKYIDAESAYQALAALGGQPTEAQVEAFTFEDFRRIRIREVEPSDSAMLNETYSVWADPVGAGSNRKLMVKYKDGVGTVRTLNLGLMS